MDSRNQKSEVRGQRSEVSGRWGVGLFLLLVVGCAGTSNFASDPLLNSTPIPKQTTPVSTPGTKQTAVPPMSSPNSTTSTAALANGAFQPLEGRSDIRPVGRTGNPQGWRGPGGVTLQAPELGNDNISRIENRTPTQGFQLTGGGRAATLEQAQVVLSSYGVTWQALESGREPGEWKFSCYIPNRQNPQIRRFHEARAKDALSAVQAVIDQIEKERTN